MVVTLDGTAVITAGRALEGFFLALALRLLSVV
jgi:hypothetical protein